MKKCIYTKKDESNATFTSAEHIFPRCVGGVNTLNKDWVSTEFNNAISKCELDFARKYPLVAMPKMILGSNGRKGNHGQAGIGFLKSSGRLTLGYIKDGQPISIPQISIFIPPFEGKNVRGIHVVANRKEEYDEFLLVLRNYKGRFQILKTSDSEIEGKLIMGLIRGQVYLGVSEQVDDAKAVDYAKKLLKSVKQIQENISTNVSAEIVERQVVYEGTVSVCLYDIMRVYGKIAFNVLAHLKGQEFALRPEFNAITNAITTGTDIDKYVRFSSPQFSKDISNRLCFDNDEHFVSLYLEGNCLMGSVVLFGMIPPVKVILSNPWMEPFEPFGYICDWRNHLESSLKDYVMQIFHKRNSLLLDE